MLRVPPKVRAPVTMTRSLELPPTIPAGPRSKSACDPVFNISEPTVRVPAVPVVPGDNMPPLLTVTVPLMVPVPSRVALVSTCTAELPKLPVTDNTPPCTSVNPVLVLVPLRIRVPVPLLLSPSVPVPFWRTPLKVVEVLLAPTVRVAEPVALTVPVPVKDPIVLENAPRFKMDVTVKAELALKAVVEPACRVPALTVVVPE